MNCAAHADVESAYFCRACGKAMCQTCCHLIEGVAYCEACLAKNVGAASQEPFGVNPWVAFGLGFIPGVGAIVNGEYLKALAHVGIFAGTITLLANNVYPGMEPLLGIFLGIFCLYMPFEAYQTARKKRALASGGAAVSPMISPGFAEEFAQDWKLNAPVGGIVLIVLGLLFFFSNMGWFHMGRIWRLWPLVLIVLGVMGLLKRLGHRS